MIWLRREDGFWQLEYYGPDGGAFLKLLLALTRIKSLALKRGLFSGSRVSFLGRLTGLERLTLVDWKLKDPPPIEHLITLQKLELNTPILSRPTDLRNFSDLRELNVSAAETVTGLESCVNLEKLFIARLKFDSLSRLNNLRKLKVAEFSEPTFLQIGPVDLPALESLVFKAVRDLEDWKGLEGLPLLKTFWLFKVPKVKALDPFKALQKLEWLLLEDCGRIESLEPISTLPRLRQVNIIGNTRIMDGRVSVLLNAPNLREVSFPSRSSYDATEAQISEALAKRRS